MKSITFSEAIASSMRKDIGRVDCESSPIIQPFSYLLDKNEVLHFRERWYAIAPENVILLHRGRPTASPFRRRSSDEYFNFILRSSSL